MFVLEKLKKNYRQSVLNYNIYRSLHNARGSNERLFLDIFFIFKSILIHYSFQALPLKTLIKRFLFLFFFIQNEKHKQTMDRNCVITVYCCCTSSRPKIRSDNTYAISFSASWCTSWISHLPTACIRWRIWLSTDFWTRWYGKLVFFFLIHMHFYLCCLYFKWKYLLLFCASR